MVHKCEYCGVTLTSLNILKRHQNKAKYCLNMQNKIIKPYKCICNKNIVDKIVLRDMKVHVKF